MVKSLAFLGLAAATVPVAGYALSLPLCLRYEKVAFAGLPTHLRGLKILHIADLHCRYPHKVHMDIWPHILALDFDMVVLTGDVILGDAAQLRPHLEGLSQMVKKAPVFYVEGNHEKGCRKEISRLFGSIGIVSLYNHRGDFAVGARSKSLSPVVSVAGFRDWYISKERNFEDLNPIFADMANSGSFHIVLSHQPQILDLLCKGCPTSALVLAGHTHGGQVRLPFMPTLFAPGQGILPKYGDGWYQSGNKKMFVSRGIGATRFPLRMFNPSEVALIELQRD